MTTVKEYLRWAAGQVGVQENPRGSNRTPYAALAGHTQGLPWCATFLVAGAKLTGLALPAGAGTASTAVDEAAFKRAGRLATTPRVGDWAFVYFPSMSRVAHVAVVYGIDGGYVLTIEGNSNDEGSREGYEVCRRRRPIHRPSGAVGIRSFGRPLYTQPKVIDPLEALLMDATQRKQLIEDVAQRAADVTAARLAPSIAALAARDENGLFVQVRDQSAVYQIHGDVREWVNPSQYAALGKPEVQIIAADDPLTRLRLVGPPPPRP